MSRLKLLKLVLEKADFGDSQETGFSRVKNYKIPAEIFKMVEMEVIGAEIRARARREKRVKLVLVA